MAHFSLDRRALLVNGMQRVACGQSFDSMKATSSAFLMCLLVGEGRVVSLSLSKHTTSYTWCLKYGSLEISKTRRRRQLTGESTVEVDRLGVPRWLCAR